MATVNLNDCFPLGSDGKRGPLPKQREFLESAFNLNGSKYVLYCGGIGSGKTLIGCITVLSWAIMYPGDYLIARQFYPELKITTLKTFLEICPKEVLLEHRVADGIVRIKSSNGRVSNIIFRQLEEPDKLRSLNLSGFYIDESSQVSETAFMLLQGRLRGNGPRKGILTSNPNGHDWQYLWFYKQDHLKSDKVKEAYKLIKAPSTENVHLPEGYVQSMLDSWSEDRIKREIYGDFDSFEGQVYSEFNRSIHVIPPFKVPDEWTKVMAIDHGYRNPTAVLWAAIDYDENVFIYREFYEREWLIEEICKGNRRVNKAGILSLTGKEKIEQCRIDPSTKARRGTTGGSDWDAYMDNLPSGFPLLPANNEKTAGIDRVKTFFKVDSRTNKPKLTIMSNCVNLIDELSKYRYKELNANEKGRVNEKEEPVKVDDHAVDALRYLIMSRPEPPKADADIWKRVKYNSLEGSLIRDLKKMKNPEPKDPFGD